MKHRHGLDASNGPSTSAERSRGIRIYITEVVMVLRWRMSSGVRKETEKHGRSSGYPVWKH